jgi:hypothetical protein
MESNESSIFPSPPAWHPSPNPLASPAPKGAKALPTGFGGGGEGAGGKGVEQLCCSRWGSNQQPSGVEGCLAASTPEGWAASCPYP